MIDKFFTRAQVRARLKSGPLGPYLDILAASLQEQQYSTDSIHRHLRAADVFGRWLATQGLSVADANEATLIRYLAGLGRRHPPSRPQGYLPQAALGLTHLIEILRQQGVVAARVETTPVTEIAKWLADYQRHLNQVLGAAAGTCRNYLHYARKLFQLQFGSAPPDWTSLTAQAIAEFVHKEAARLKPYACQTLITATRSFLRFLVIRGVAPAGLEGAVPTIRQWKLASLPTHLSSDEVARVLATCQEGTSMGNRDRAILLLLARLGLRAGEIVDLRLEDIDWAEGRLLIRAGKSHGERSLPLSDEVGRALIAYLKHGRPKGPDRHVFLRCRAPLGPLKTSVAITTLTGRHLRRAGISARRRGAHVLRHTAATRMVRQGISFKEVADILGHQSLTTTAIYAKLDTATLSGVALPWPGGAQ